MSDPRAPASLPKSSRDTRLDALRGLFLVIMAAVHVPTPLSHWLHEPFGYVSAAEGFVFLGACLAGFVYSKVRRKHGAAVMNAGLFARMRKIYVVHLGVLVATALIVWPLGGRVTPLGNHFHDFLQHPWASLALMPLLLHQPPLFDILPLYIIFFALTPAVLRLAQRRGWAIVLGLSAAVWLVAQFQPFAPFAAGLVAPLAATIERVQSARLAGLVDRRARDRRDPDARASRAAQAPALAHGGRAARHRRRPVVPARHPAAAVDGAAFPVPGSTNGAWVRCAR